MAPAISYIIMFFIIACGGALFFGSIGEKIGLPVPASVAAGLVWAAIWYWILFTP